MSIDHAQLDALLKRVKALRKLLKSETNPNVAKKSLRDEAAALGSTWHRDFAPMLKHALSPESLEIYNSQFTRLIKLSSPNNSRASYMTALDAIIKPFNDELLIPVQQGSLTGSVHSAFDAFFAGLSNAESDYLAEAVACAKNGHLRAAAVLGWSAAIDRIHRVLEHKGLDKFNAMSQQMKGATVGRYKRFDKSQSVANLAELREVFDTVILWVIEGMGMIDTNQHTRLLSCFDMRCHGAHPGEAPITQYNLMSFFSDLDQIIFVNDKFKLPASATVGAKGVL
ncbi:hypothetical protein [Paraburkholderia heleia]|uniref:hypothetical protein n=1 Tax=Paraburkholderia heleia TaxID=634127 RepID=UPI002AB68ECA|nr:hypothetical protein [Paraburkholderia heleia]